MEENTAQKKAELAEQFINKTRPGNLMANFRVFRREFKSIEPKKSYTADPFIDEVCSGRLLNLIRQYFMVYVPGYSEGDALSELRVSDLPSLQDICVKRGFGRISQREYADLLKKYRV